MAMPLERRYPLVTIIGNIWPEEQMTQKYLCLEGKLLADRVLLTAKYSLEGYLKTTTTGLIWAMIYGTTNN